MLVYDAPHVGRWTNIESPGADALRDEIIARYGVGSAGIVRDEDRCGTDDSPSRHCWSPYGAAAWDPVPLSREQGWQIAQTLVANAEPLGVQGLNYWGMRWGFGRWFWRRLHPAEDQHTSHIHVELNDKGARSLTRARIADVLDGADPAPSDPPDDEEDEQMTLERGQGMSTVWAVRGDRTGRRQVASGADLERCKVAQGSADISEVDSEWLAHVPIIGKTTNVAQPAYTI